MITLKETKIQIEPRHWCVRLMDFVDDFRRHRDLGAAAEPFELSDERPGALLASTAEASCDEIGVASPAWPARVPECERPYFVGELENLKAIPIVESPLRFRLRKIFVLENFLSRV
jgi:hypothetical protein